MSVFPAEITMQICSAPAAIMRSTRYSETALGLSASSTRREPTGSNSLEQPRGWIRCPAPAAGMIPIIRPPPRPRVLLRVPLQNIAATALPALRRYVHPRFARAHEQPWRANSGRLYATRFLLVLRWPLPEGRPLHQRTNPGLPTNR